MEERKSTHINPMHVTKAAGHTELFVVEKLERSLRNAGAEPETIAKIVANLDSWMTPGISTKKIYTHAFSTLRRDKSSNAIRYRLKQAILELGPTGYPFESLIGELFKRQGFETEVGVVVNGNCVTHEMDVIATAHHLQHLAECKYHKDQGKQVSVQVPLYVRSRVNDIIKLREGLPKYDHFSFYGWVITNTRFSADSIQYGTCSGLKLLAWDFPQGKGLKDLIEKYKLFPITILSRLNKQQKQQLLDVGVVTCWQLKNKPEHLISFGLTKRKIELVIAEIAEICM